MNEPLHHAQATESSLLILLRSLRAAPKPLFRFCLRSDDVSDQELLCSLLCSAHRFPVSIKTPQSMQGLRSCTVNPFPRLYKSRRPPPFGVDRGSCEIKRERDPPVVDTSGSVLFEDQILDPVDCWINLIFCCIGYVTNQRNQQVREVTCVQISVQ